MTTPGWSDRIVTDESAYGQHLSRKRGRLQRPELSCGCPNDGRTTFVRGCCDEVVCEVHGKVEHEHAEPPPAEPDPAPRFTEQPVSATITVDPPGSTSWWLRWWTA